MSILDCLLPHRTEKYKCELLELQEAHRKIKLSPECPDNNYEVFYRCGNCHAITRILVVKGQIPEKIIDCEGCLCNTAGLGNEKDKKEWMAIEKKKREQPFYDLAQLREKYYPSEY